MADASTKDSKDLSLFQTKYNEFVDDLLGALPEYASKLEVAKGLDEKTRLRRFQEEVKIDNSMTSEEDNTKNPGKVLPDVVISDKVWATLSDHTKKSICEYVRIVSICCFMEAGCTEDSKPSWMDDAMEEMKKKLESTDFQDIIKKFMTFFKSVSEPSSSSEEMGDKKSEDSKSGLPPGLENLFEKGFPKLPEKFLKGHLAKLAQEIVKDITPDDLGISEEMMANCEKDPSRAFTLLFSTFTNNPSVIQKTIAKIGKRLQQKMASGAIRPQEIAREAEELMKEFSSNSSFVEMMEGIKSAFGFEDMDLAKKAGREGSARLSLVRERLRKKLEKNKQAQNGSNSSNGKKK